MWPTNWLPPICLVFPSPPFRPGNDSSHGLAGWQILCEPCPQAMDLSPQQSLMQLSYGLPILKSGDCWYEYATGIAGVSVVERNEVACLRSTVTCLTICPTVRCDLFGLQVRLSHGSLFK
nr:hypothetical protein CFP56_53733 [Quercus suber]